MNFFSDEPLSLDRLRSALMRMEDTIIFGLIERGHFKVNSPVYTAGALPFKVKFDGSFLDYFLAETEKLHATVRRYTSPDETPFTTNLPEPVLEALTYPRLLKPNNISVNDRIKSLYINQIIPSLCQVGDDTNYGSTATVDVQCLQNISRRIHYGKFIAEAKFADPLHTAEYTELIRQQDSDALMELLTNREVEKKLLARLHKKASMYGQDLDSPNSTYMKINPSVVVELYEKWVIPLTKEVEVDYLLQRLDSDQGVIDSKEDDEGVDAAGNDQNTSSTATSHSSSADTTSSTNLDRSSSSSSSRNSNNSADSSLDGKIKRTLLASHRGSETKFFYLDTPSESEFTSSRNRSSSDLQ